MLKVILVIFRLAICGTTLRAQEQDTPLIPKHFTLDNTYNGTQLIYALQNQLYFSFDVPVNVKPAAPAIILCEDDTIAKGFLKNYAIEYSGGKGGYVEAEFDSLLLPKGKDYTLVIEAGSIYKQDNPSCTNAEIRRDFNVPAHIKMDCQSPREGETLNELKNMSINLSARQDYQSNFRPTIYKGEEILNYNSYVLTMYHLSYNLSFDFYGSIPLEDGADYTIVVPEGVMTDSRLLYRNDISNEEMRIHIKGGNVTGITTGAQAERPHIHCNGKTLHIDNAQGQRIRIFSPDGRIVQNTVCREHSTAFVLSAAGLYIVNVGGHSDKISVK